MNKMSREVRRLSSSRDLRKGPGGYVYSGGAASVNEPWTLKHTLSGTSCTISAGTISYGDIDIAVAEDTVTLTGTPAFVYIRLTRATNAATIAQASTRPSSDSTYAYFPLVSFTASAGVYTLDKIHHRGDIFLQVPMQ